MNKEVTTTENHVNETNSGAVPFAVVESYKTIRTNLLFLLSQTKEKAITISSSVPGEGKSTTAINVAIAFSQLGSRILLIDGDMRKPSIHKKLRLPNEKGLSSLLVGFSEIEDVVHTINANLDVMTAGPTPPNPSELLGSDNMAQLLVKFNDMYDYVIIDTPPINIVSDSIVVAPHTSGIVFVVQDNVTTHEQLKKALNSVEFAGVRMLGIILNGSNNNINKKYKYNRKYRYNYNYGYHK